jgi:hypothetical protein
VGWLKEFSVKCRVDIHACGPVSINISRDWPPTLLDNIKTGGVVKIKDPADLYMPLVFRFQVIRCRTKSHSFILNQIEENAYHLANELAQEIIKQTYKYPFPTIHNPRTHGYCLNINDVLAVSRFGQASLKRIAHLLG